MIYAAPGQTFIALLTNAPVGLGDAMTAGIENIDGSTEQAAVSTGVVEVEPGAYVATRVAPVGAASYVFNWVNTDADHTEQEELLVSYVTPAIGDWLPANTDVASLLRARTFDQDSEQEGLFTENTRPTDVQVDGLIAQAAFVVEGRVGTLSTERYGQARHAATLYAAMLVELSYYPEQSTEADSAYQRLKDLWDEAIAALMETTLDGSPARKGMFSIPMIAVGRNGITTDTDELLP